jgi:hypothetical protein
MQMQKIVSTAGLFLCVVSLAGCGGSSSGSNAVQVTPPDNGVERSVSELVERLSPPGESMAEQVALRQTVLAVPSAIELAGPVPADLRPPVND